MHSVEDTEYWTAKLEQLRIDTLDVDSGAEDARNTVELDQTKVGRLSRMDALQGQAMNNAIAARPPEITCVH